MKMDELFKWLGAEVVDYPVKAHCCGGHMTQISEPQAFELIRRLLQSAVDYQADLILCMCPMCQLNLDAYQGARERATSTRTSTCRSSSSRSSWAWPSGWSLEKLGFGKEIGGGRAGASGKTGGDGGGGEVK